MILSNNHEIYRRRVLLGFSMRQLAEKAQVNVGTISNIERNPKAVAPRTAKQICDALQTPMEELFEITQH